jgi:hemin uptake protein HemP
MRTIIVCNMPIGTARAVAPALPQKRLTTEQLMGTAREIVIVHNGREYRLRLTQNGKLILTA